MSNKEKDEGAPLRSEEFLVSAMERFGGSVYLVALSQTRSEQDAQDVAQDVFVRLFCSTTRFVDDEHLKAWLLRVTINRCHELYRGFWRRSVSTLDDERDLDEAARSGAGGAGGAGGVGDGAGGRPGSLADDPADVLVRRLERTPVWSAVARLPSDQRAALVLFYVEEYSCDQIAQVMGVRPATVRTKLHRARLRLRKMLEREGYEDGYAYE
jgi:RNA polymerase sigma factor (sigma-70 family)